MAQARRQLRVLLSEGSSTAAREALTLLAAAGHAVEICDPDMFCLARFSRLHAAFHRCPGLRDDPAGYLAFIEGLLSRRRFDVLLPIHEQGLALARVAPRLAGRTGLALPSYENYRTAHSKTGFGRLLDALGLARPPSRFLGRPAEPPGDLKFPCVLKAAIGTASRGTAVLGDAAALAAAWPRLRATGADLLAEAFVPGPLERAQAVFAHGDMVGFHAYAQVMAGAGGGDAVKESVVRPQVRIDLGRIGARLAWHGALSVDFIRRERDGAAVYIDCNPRLVEPVNAARAGVDLLELLVAISLGERPAAVADGRPGLRTHLALQALFGAALRERTRRAVWRIAADLIAGREPFGGSEELTPLRRDWPSAIPLAIATLCLVAAPRLAGRLAASGWGAHLVGPHTIARIEECA